MALRNKLPSLWHGEREVWNPVREIGRLQKQIEHVFDEFMLPQLFGHGDFLPSEAEGEFAPACDIEETDKNYLVTFDLPGIRKEDVKIEIKENQLIVSGERKDEKKEGRSSRERFYGSFFRSFTLPPQIEPDQVEANYENGVLQIAIPKPAAAATKEVPIHEGRLIEPKGTKPEKAA